MHDFELKVAQSRYAGWKSLQVTRSIESLAHSFGVSLTDQWEDGSTQIPIESGDACEVSIDGARIVTGYIFEDSDDEDAKNHAISFTGRSSTGDLVDCAAIHPTGQWRNTGLLKIAQDLCDPFGITVTTNVDLGKKFTNPNFKLQEGETVFDALSRGARMRGVLMQTDANGNLFFDRSGSSAVTTVIERGKNVIRSSKKNSWTDRFSTYTVKTQSSGTDEMNGKSTSLKRSSNDDGVNRYRPIIIMAENEDSGTELQKRANWERNTRAGRSKRLIYTIPGWKHLDGLWEPNTMIRVIDPVKRVDDYLLAVEVVQSKDSRGEITTITLTLKEAFDVQPLPQPKKKGAPY